MATQIGMGFLKTLLLVGTGFMGSIMVQNGRLSEILGDLQLVMKGLEKSGDSSNTDSDVAFQGMDKPSKKALGLLELTEDTSLKDLKLIGDNIKSAKYEKKPITDSFMKNNSDKKLVLNQRKKYALDVLQSTGMLESPKMLTRLVP